MPKILLNSLTNTGTGKTLQVVLRRIQRAETCTGKSEKNLQIDAKWIYP